MRTVNVRLRWWQPVLANRLREGREPALVPVAELEGVYRDALRRLKAISAGEQLGDYLEFGVYVGTSLLCMQRASTAEGLSDLRLFGFDSFEGLPKAAAGEDEGRFLPGQFRASHDLVSEHLTKNGIDWSRTTLVPGWFDTTLSPSLARRLGIERASLIMIDCDIYSSARAALEFSAPLIRDRTVIVFDDWPVGRFSDRNIGEQRAFAEFLNAHPDVTAEELGSYAERGRVFLLTKREAAVAAVQRRAS